MVDHSRPADMNVPVTGRRLTPLSEQLESLLPRFAGYATRFVAALRRVNAGERGWVDAVGIDSCHAVWFELHEDLVATLGVEASADPPTGRL